MWAYHKLIVLAPFILVFIIVFTYNFVQNARYETVLNVAIVDGIEADKQWITQEAKDSLNIENRFSRVLIDGNYLTTGSGYFDFNTIQKFTVITGSQEMDILISNQVIYHYYLEFGAFMDLSRLFTTEELSTMNLIDSYAIDISNYPVIQERFNLHYEKVYFMVIANADIEEVNHDGVTKGELIRGFYFHFMR
jgi:hypothetical protein